MTTKQQRIKDLFTTAFEGGSNYWAEMRVNLKPINQHLSPSERIFEAVMRGNEFRIFDVENPSDVLGKLNKANLNKGYSLMIANHEEHYADVLSERWDASTADVFLQLAVLGEITFG